ncbi:MAG: DUF177 domain-containing protein [Candidatus Binatia bacterium]
MKLQLDDIKATPKTVAYAEEVEDLNRRLARGVQDYRLPDAVRVELTCYRAGLDVFLTGRLRAGVRAACARCTEDFALTVEVPVTLVLVPRAAETGDAELTTEDLALSFYEGKEIDLTPLVHEQLMLALPTRPLCREDCRGLCSRCGVNLNVTSCSCASAAGQPRLAVIQQLVRGKTT